MKYFIGVPIPKSYKNKIEMIRAEFRFLTTEPHITLVPPPALPDDDSFIKDVIDVCRKTKAFNIKLNDLGQFGNRVLFVNVEAPELINLYNNIYESLNLQKEERGYTPHLTIAKQRPNRKIDLEKIKKRAGKLLVPYPEYTLNSIVIYCQPKEKFMYIPYMKIPLGQ
ncbi:MAG: 2'-5' RNA ligase family protein [Sedimentibacter sp.]|uniref:2'-5' RNA ligase family protein n=1 Tax=Sedimentibacter sp. TaxID=1960295 RepID=UPI0029810DAC|nr:2'-5' RNA ligase family protein [Sedimentibacter sp.]MDW5299274.1 2'-5' RNA ligase family protein [Sedimentibacter sp.]